MRPNSAATVYGGAGGRNSRASVSSLEGLRNVLATQADRNSAPALAAPPGRDVPDASFASAAPPEPEDNKQTLQGLNTRLSDYLKRVKELQEENDNLKKEIDDIMAKRNVPDGRDWDEIEKTMEEDRQKIKDIALQNTKLLIDIRNSQLANKDWKKQLENEEKTRKELENDLKVMEEETDDLMHICDHTRKENDSLKNEIKALKEDHKNEVKTLRERIRKSEVTVLTESPNSSLGDIVKKIRVEYEKQAEKNRKEIEDWYQGRYEQINMSEVKENKRMESEMDNLKDLFKQKQMLEIKIQALYGTMQNLEETLRNVKLENGQRLAPKNNVILRLEEDLKGVRSQVEMQAEKNKNLVSVKMKLEEEIKRYQHLIQHICEEADSFENSPKKVVASDKKPVNP